MTTSTPVQMIILVGSSGSGKTWVGEVLSSRLGLQFLDMERMLLSEYGTTEAFVAEKPRALDWFESRVRDAAAGAASALVFEIGAFSQRPTVDRLMRDYHAAVVLVEAPPAVRRRRLYSRPKGRHFTDDPEAAMRHDELFEREVKPTYPFTFEIDNTGLTEEELEARVVNGLRDRNLALLGVPPN